MPDRRPFFAYLLSTGQSYTEYLQSPHFTQVRAEYRDSGLPCCCVYCQNPCYQLHHLTYERIGREIPTDLLPLCNLHHIKVHQGPDLTDAQADRLRKKTKQALRLMKAKTKVRVEARPPKPPTPDPLAPSQVEPYKPNPWHVRFT